MSCKCQEKIVEDVLQKLRNVVCELDVEQQFVAVDLVDAVIVEIAEKYLNGTNTEEKETISTHHW